MIYSAVLAGVFVFPHYDKDWGTEIFFVIIVFPLIVALGAGTNAKGAVHKICLFLGRLSYPLYMTHYWMMWILAGYMETNPGAKNLYYASGITVIAAIGLAYAVLKLYDEPVRKWLTMRIKRSK